MSLVRSRALVTVSAWILALAALSPQPSSSSASWPSLRGPSFDGAARDGRLFAGADKGLQVAWKRPLGSGYSMVAVADGRAVTQFSEGGDDLVAAFDAATGEELWRYRLGEIYKGHSGSHDGPIATPVLAEGRVFGLGPRGLLAALDAATGRELWKRHLSDDLGAEAPYYGFGSSPIFIDGVLVVEIGGEGKSIAGFDPEDGELLWSLGDEAVEYNSPVAVELAGRRQVVAAGGKTLYGIDPATGEVLWSHAHGGDETAMGGATIIPLAAGGDRLLLLHRSDASTMLQVAPGTGGFAVSELWTGPGISRTYVQPVIHAGHVYGMVGRILTCIDAATGETRWRSREPGDGFLTLVGDQLVILTKEGSLHVAEASAEGYREAARLDLFADHAWSAVAFAGGHLYARSLGELARIEPAAGAAAAAEIPSWVAATSFGRFLAEVAAAADKQPLVEAYLARQSSFPIVEPGGAVHFVFRGEGEEVGIVGDMIGLRREESMERLAGTDLFHYSTRLEPDAAVTYGFLPGYEDAVADPLNPRPGAGLFGEVSWFAMPAWEPPVFAGGEAPSTAGSLETVEWESEVREGAKRSARVYLPAGYAGGERRYPTLYVLSGGDAIEAGETQKVLDRLLGVAAEPLIAVFPLAPEDNPRADLADAEGFARMVAGELVPLVDGRYRTRTARLDRAVAGTGGAATAALRCAFRHNDLFGRVAAQAPIFLNLEEIDFLGQADEQPLVIYHEWGTYHLRGPNEGWDMAENNRRLWRRLREHGYRPAGGEVPDGFGWACWKARTDDWLTALFPLPAAG